MSGLSKEFGTGPVQPAAPPDRSVVTSEWPGARETGYREPDHVYRQVSMWTWTWLTITIEAVPFATRTAPASKPVAAHAVVHPSKVTLGDPRHGFGEVAIRR